MCTAFPSIAWNTGSSSPGELLMTLSTSAVAVCCCREFARNFAEETRVFDGDDGLRGEIFDQLNLSVSERPHFLAVNGNRTDQLALLQHRDNE